MTKVKEQDDLVTPGEVIAEDEELYANDGVFNDNDKIKSKYLGTVRYQGEGVKVTPMGGRYIPSEGDLVIGEVKEVRYNRWTVSFDSAYDGALNIGDAVDEYIDLEEDDLTDYFDTGDTVVAQIQSVSNSMDVDLTMEDERCKKLKGGRIVSIAPSKVPRVIGKKGTMVKQINNKTNCNIIVGQNGKVWINGEKPNLAAKAVKKVEKEAHTSGLTDKIGEWLENQLEGDK